MTASMTGMVARNTAVLSSMIRRGELPLRFTVTRQPCHHALVTAWRQMSGTSRYLAKWVGPGIYELSGNCTDGATVTKVAELPAPAVTQGELGL